jgi:hypothetical protein
MEGRRKGKREKEREGERNNHNVKWISSLNNNK